VIFVMQRMVENDLGLPLVLNVHHLMVPHHHHPHHHHRYCKKKKQ
jgi:hypothetical protein